MTAPAAQVALSKVATREETLHCQEFKDPSCNVLSVFSECYLRVGSGLSLHGTFLETLLQVMHVLRDNTASFIEERSKIS